MVDVLFDSTRLIMRASRTSPTGIDRVTEAYGRWLLMRPDVNVIPVCTLGGVISPMDKRILARILDEKRATTAASSDAWRSLNHALRDEVSTGTALRSRIRRGAIAAKALRYATAGVRFIANWRPRSIGAGAIYLNVSHYGLEQPRIMQKLAARGIRIVAMVHDLIPISYPEYCSPTAGPWHRQRIEQLLQYAELILTNSQSTEDELRDFARAIGVEAPRLCAAPLGVETAFSASAREFTALGPYFVCVGTLEPRKNLNLLFGVWRRLAERLGKDTPPLILAGRRGWESESIIDHLERSPAVRRHVHEVSGLNDAELADLIAGATALLSPSYTEGFNLPVAEALTLGAPVIASDIPVHRELASGAQLIDPLDGPAWLAVIENAIRVRPATPAVTLPNWSEHFATVAAALGLPL